MGLKNVNDLNTLTRNQTQDSIWTVDTMSKINTQNKITNYVLIKMTKMTNLSWNSLEKLHRQLKPSQQVYTKVIQGTHDVKSRSWICVVYL